MSVTTVPQSGAHAASRPPATADDKPLTRNERVVLKKLQTAPHPLKAYQLLESLHESGMRAPMTIYRALSSLMQRGLVRKIASANAFVAAAPDMRSAPGAYFLCKSCGRAFEKPLDAKAIALLFTSSGLKIDTVFVEAHGECLQPECRAPARR